MTFFSVHLYFQIFLTDRKKPSREREGSQNHSRISAYDTTINPQFRNIGTQTSMEMIPDTK